MAGWDNYSLGDKQWRIEKRDLTTGALIAAFGTAGVVTSNPSAGDDCAQAITADASGIYVAGFDKFPGNDEWRIEKRDLTTGALACTTTSNPSVGFDVVRAITAYASGLYVAGLDESLGDIEWRIEKYDGVCVSSVIEGLESKKGISIYPNPFNYSVTIQLSSTINNGELNIFNLYGQTTKTINNISGDKIIINRDNLPSGLYFIRLTEENKTIAADKLVITDK